MSLVERAADVWLRGKFAPYVRQARRAGAAGTLVELAQPPGDMSDPPVNDLVLIRAVSDGRSYRSDLEAGRFDATSRPGSLFLVAPRTATNIHVRNPHVIRVLGVPAAESRSRLEPIRPRGDPFDFGRLHAGPVRDLLVLALFDRLWEEAAQGDVLGRPFAKSAVLAIAAGLARAAEGQPAPTPARGGLAPADLRRVTEALADRLNTDVSLAALAGLSASHLCRAFKQSTGLPPHRWFVARRLERARALLAGTSLPVAEVAAAVGYDDPGYFARLFRREVGATPLTYRRECRS